MGFDVAILHFGANDINQGATAETFQLDTEMLIARIRAWTKDTQFPVILMSDPYQKGLDTASEEAYARYPGAQRAIAASDPQVLLVNSRRLMDERGDGKPAIPTGWTNCWQTGFTIPPVVPSS
jgi:lysophospholipase L1-like esterase